MRLMSKECSFETPMSSRIISSARRSQLIRITLDRSLRTYSEYRTGEVADDNQGTLAASYSDIFRNRRNVSGST